MPPKRQQRSPSRVTTKRKKTASASSVVQVQGVVSDATQSLPTIDYDKLALAVIKHSSNKTQEQIATLPEDNTRPAVISLPAESYQDTTPLVSVAGPSSPQLNIPAPNSLSNENPALGDLLDKVFAGEPARSTEMHNFSTNIVSDGIPLASSVPHKLKLKIWNNEFIDFRSLLGTREEPVSLSISTGIIQLHQSPKFKSPINISQWTDAFLLFMAVYIEKYSTEAPHLLKYAHMVREIYQLHGDNAFRSYDEQFRKLRETMNLPWQQPNQELRLRAATLPKTSPGKQSHNQNQPFRVRFCFQFNKGERCNKNPCPFKHSCSQCKGNHPKSKCTGFKPQQQSKSPNTNQNK